MTDHALILVNLGSTPSTAVADVRRYLDQFLMDRHVIDVPWPLRRLIVSQVLRTRPAASAAAYRSIWWGEGSPLLVVGKRLQAKMAQRWQGAPVELAMRYGEPSIEQALRSLAIRGVERATLVPLYPQFADSTVTSILEEARRVLQRHGLHLRLDVIPPFHGQPEYLSALGASILPYLRRPYDHLLLSYHGLPERHVRKADPTGRHCLCSATCCRQPPADVLESCYRAQCVRTSEQVTAALGMPRERWSLAFQSRLGRAKWIAPHTDAVLGELARRGVRRLLVACPAFVADCIETLEEIGIRGRETFLAAGGEELTLIPCLNDQPYWADALAKLCRRIPEEMMVA